MKHIHGFRKKCIKGYCKEEIKNTLINPGEYFRNLLLPTEGYQESVRLEKGIRLLREGS